VIMKKPIFQNQTGFTLIEVLIVVAIFAVITSIGYVVLTQYISTTEKLELNQIRIQKLQQTFSLLEKDFRYIQSRSVRNEFGDFEASFAIENSSQIPGELIRFTTAHADYLSYDTGKLVRVVWSLDGDSLIRNTWPVVDRDESIEISAQEVLHDVDRVEIQMYEWTDTFRLQTVANLSDGIDIPYGLKLTLFTNDGFEYYRIFDIANGT